MKQFLQSINSVVMNNHFMLGITWISWIDVFFKIFVVGFTLGNVIFFILFSVLMIFWWKKIQAENDKSVDKPA